MKKKYLLLVLVLLVLAIVLLNTSVDRKADFSGEWYSAGNHSHYIFQDGLIYCKKHTINLDDGSSISGAYVSAGNKIALFACGVEGLEVVQELYLIENKEEMILCSNRKGNGKIYFIRENSK